MREGISLPDNWAPMPSHEKVSLVTLNTNSIEYQDVVRQFQATVPNVNVKKIERVQNPELYRTFKVKKQEMDKRYGGNSERKLFHGTDGKSIDAINTQGFNRSFCGRNGRCIQEPITSNRCIWLQTALENTEQANSYHKRPLLYSPLAHLPKCTLLYGWVCFRLAIGQFAVRNLLYGPKFLKKCSFRCSRSLYLAKKL